MIILENNTEEGFIRVIANGEEWYIYSDGYQFCLGIILLTRL